MADTFTHLRTEIVDRFLVDWLRIYPPVSGGVVGPDFVTRYPAADIVWEGPCRVEPGGVRQVRQAGGADLLSDEVDVSIPADIDVTLTAGMVGVFESEQTQIDGANFTVFRVQLATHSATTTVTFRRPIQVTGR